MPFDTYFDLTMRPDPDIPVWDCIGQVWRMVHVAGVISGVDFAVAFPGWMAEGFTVGNTLRVFAQGAQASERLYDEIEKAPRLLEFAEGSRVRSAKNATAFEAYMMRRVPSGVSKIRKSIPLDAQLQLQADARARRLAQQQSLPFVRMRSSTGKAFRLTIDRVAAAAEHQGRPNGYGLSRSTQIVALPVV